ncbi:MAG: GNAT family N-acetyltransferase [Mycobacteriales bacterium]
MDGQSSEVVDVPEEDHYAIRVNGEQVGLAAYTLSASTITFTHTETDPEMQGQGIAGDLVHHALDDVRRRGLDVVAQCSFVREWIDEHEEYADLVASP